MPSQLLTNCLLTSMLCEFGEEENRKVVYRDPTGDAYWLTETGRYQICGQPVGDSVCFAPAGDSTSHVGKGMCKEHDAVEGKGVFATLTATRKKSFAKHMIDVDELPDNQLLNPMELLKGMHGMLRSVMQIALDPEGNVERLWMPELRQLMSDVKGMQHSILEQRISIMDLTNSIELVDVIFSSIQRHVNIEVADLIFEDVQEVIAPMAAALDPTSTYQPAGLMR